MVDDVVSGVWSHGLGFRVTGLRSGILRIQNVQVRAQGVRSSDREFMGQWKHSKVRGLEP